MSRRGSSKALALAELVLAISIATVVAGAVAGLAAGLSRAHASTDVLRETVHSMRMGMMRLERALRTAKLVTAAETARLVLWTGDANGDGEINVDELLLMGHDAEAGTLVSRHVVFPEGMGRGLRKVLNAPLPLEACTDAAGVDALLDSAVYRRHVARLVLAEGVTGFAAGALPPAPRTTLVTLELAAGPPGRRLTLSAAVRLRADATEAVDRADEQWVLKLP